MTPRHCLWHWALTLGIHLSTAMPVRLCLWFADGWDGAATDCLRVLLAEYIDVSTLTG